MCPQNPSNRLVLLSHGPGPMQTLSMALKGAIAFQTIGIVSFAKKGLCHTTLRVLPPHCTGAASVRRTAAQHSITTCDVTDKRCHTLHLLSCPADDYNPLNPLPVPVDAPGAHQRTDIYPGVSGRPLPTLSRRWNDFVLIAPSREEILPIYAQGRADAIWWVRQNFAKNGPVLRTLARGLDSTVLTEGVVAAIAALARVA
jgi:hypothetical protein